MAIEFGGFEKIVEFVHRKFTRLLTQFYESLQKSSSNFHYRKI